MLLIDLSKALHKKMSKIFKITLALASGFFMAQDKVFSANKQIVVKSIKKTDLRIFKNLEFYEFLKDYSLTNGITNYNNSRLKELYTYFFMNMKFSRYENIFNIPSDNKHEKFLDIIEQDDYSVKLKKEISLKTPSLFTDNGFSVKNIFYSYGYNENNVIDFQCDFINIDGNDTPEFVENIRNFMNKTCLSVFHTVTKEQLKNFLHVLYENFHYSQDQKDLIIHGINQNLQILSNIDEDMDLANIDYVNEAKEDIQKNIKKDLFSIYENLCIIEFFKLLPNLIEQINEEDLEVNMLKEFFEDGVQNKFNKALSLFQVNGAKIQNEIFQIDIEGDHQGDFFIMMENIESMAKLLNAVKNHKLYKESSLEEKLFLYKEKLPEKIQVFFNDSILEKKKNLLSVKMSLLFLKNEILNIENSIEVIIQRDSVDQKTFKAIFSDLYTYTLPQDPQDLIEDPQDLFKDPQN